MDYTFSVRLLGVRGTVPVHGPEFTRFGGGTSCVLLKAGGRGIILDAGTGLSARAFRDFYSGKQFSILISHAHADHLMGFPVFTPFFDPGCQCDVYLRTRADHTARQQIETLMAPPLWPVRTDAFRAELTFHDVPETFRLGPVRVDTLESCHPGGSVIYKLSYGGVSVVYATDYEPQSAAPRDFCTFAKGCSLLMIDAQYTDEEYPKYRGFGHSTLERSAEIARRCEAAQTILVHHDPGRTDSQLLNLEETLQKAYPDIRLGRAGEEVILQCKGY